MSEQKRSKSLSGKTTDPKENALIRLYMSASTLRIFGCESARSGTLLASLPKHFGGKAIAGEPESAIPKEQPEIFNYRQCKAACQEVQGAMYAQAGGLRDPGCMPGPWHKAKVWTQQEVNLQLAELGPACPQCGVCEGKCNDNEQACEQHKELSNISGAGAPGVRMA